MGYQVALSSEVDAWTGVRTNSSTAGKSVKASRKAKTTPIAV